MLESIVHSKKKVYGHLYLLFIHCISFCTNVLHIKWNLACPITVHFICYHKWIQQIQNTVTSMKKIYSWWTSCRSCWSGQRFSSTSHLMFSIAMHRGKISLNAAHIRCDVPTCSIHGFQQRHLILWSMIISTSMLKKTILLDLRMESMVQVLHSQKMVVMVLWAIYIYMLPNLTG